MCREPKALLSDCSNLRRDCTEDPVPRRTPEDNPGRSEDQLCSADITQHHQGHFGQTRRPQKRTLGSTKEVKPQQDEKQGSGVLLLGAKGERDRETASLPSSLSNEGMADKEGRTGAKSQEQPLQRSSWPQQSLSCRPSEPQGPLFLWAPQALGYVE